MTTIGKRIKFYRKQKGLTQKELGTLINKSGQVVSNWERGYTQNITNEDILLLSKKLAISINELLDDSENQNKAKDNSSLPPLTKKEERDIAKDLEDILEGINSSNSLSFYGEPMDEETKELMKISLENSMKMAKQIAKQKFTPKKYRKK